MTKQIKLSSSIYTEILFGRQNHYVDFENTDYKRGDTVVFYEEDDNSVDLLSVGLEAEVTDIDVCKSGKACVLRIKHNSSIISSSSYTKDEIQQALDTISTPKGYHIKYIKKGKLGEISKIQEELDELKDSEEQGIKLMSLIELSDLIGAIEAYLEKYFEGIAMDDLLEMSYVTKRAFKAGHR